MRSTPFRIALLGQGLAHWGGGLEMLRILTNALVLKQPTHSVEIKIMLAEVTALSRLKRWAYPYKEAMKELAQLRPPQFSRPWALAATDVLDFLRQLNAKLDFVYYDGSVTGLAKALERMHTDVVLPCVAPVGADFSTPWVGYIPDLQHKHLPEFFSDKERASRDCTFSTLLEQAKCVMVNGIAVREDIQRWYPDHQCRIFALPFCPTPHADWLNADPAEVKLKYSLPDRYFVIANQFWVHKSHKTAFTALKSVVAASDCSDVHIVCTGKTQDYRFPRYFDELQDMVREAGLSDRVKYLGFIPKHDQIQVIRGAVAVVQPTLFEGGPGGGAVYDALAVGARAIVSDIPINREIEASDDVVFFQCGSVADLTEKMLAVLRAPRPEHSPTDLLKKGDTYAQRLGDRLLEIAAFASGTGISLREPLSATAGNAHRASTLAVSQ